MPIQTINNKYHQVKLSKTTYERIMEIGIIVFAMLAIWSVLIIAAGWNNHGRKRKYEYTGNIRKIKRKYVNKIGYYRSVMAFYRKHLPENEWVNNDIRSISRGVFIKSSLFEK